MSTRGWTALRLTTAERACRVWVIGVAVGLVAPTSAWAEDALPAIAADDPDAAAWRDWRQHPSAWTAINLVDRLVAGNRMVEARRAADELTAKLPDDAQVAARLGYLHFMLQDYARAVADFEHALLGPNWTADQRKNLLNALANSADAAGDPAAAVRALRQLGPRMELASRLRLGRAQLATRDRRASAATAREVIALATTVGEREDGEQLLADAAQPIDDPSGVKLLNMGYAYLRQHDDVAGLAAFRRGFALGAGKAFHFADAAYAAKRLGDNAAAIDLFKFSLDLDGHEHFFSEQRVYGFRREIETMERQWGCALGTPYQAGALDVWQGGVEAFWQPPVIGYRDGRVLQFFVRAFENFRNGASGPIGWSTLQETVGVRYKPVASQNIVLVGERLIAVGNNAVNDWLTRVGYSTGAGTDRRLDVSTWASWQVRGEAAYYWNSRHLLVGSEVRYGVVWPLPGLNRLTLYPHAWLAVEYDNVAAPQLVDATGPGLSLRLWFGEDRYRAPPGWLEINANYRFADAERGRGPALRATLSF